MLRFSSSFKLPPNDKGEEPPSSSATSKLADAMLFSLTDTESCQNVGNNASSKEFMGFMGVIFFLFADGVDAETDDSLLHCDESRDPREYSRSTFSTEVERRFNCLPFSEGRGVALSSFPSDSVKVVASSATSPTEYTFFETLLDWTIL